MSARSRAMDGVTVMFSTRLTGTSLWRCASSRRAPYSSVSTTTVMRETPGVSVWPTVSDSMLKARSEEHTSELQSHRDLHSFPTRRSSDLLEPPRAVLVGVDHHRHARDAGRLGMADGERLDVEG